MKWGAILYGVASGLCGLTTLGIERLIYQRFSFRPNRVKPIETRLI